MGIAAGVVNRSAPPDGGLWSGELPHPAGKERVLDPVAAAFLQDFPGNEGIYGPLELGAGGESRLLVTGAVLMSRSAVGSTRKNPESSALTNSSSRLQNALPVTTPV